MKSVRSLRFFPFAVFAALVACNDPDPSIPGPSVAFVDTGTQLFTEAGESRTFVFAASYYTVLTCVPPEGWEAVIDETAATVTLTAPQSDVSTGGRLTLTVTNDTGQTAEAALDVLLHFLPEIVTDLTQWAVFDSTRPVPEEFAFTASDGATVVWNEDNAASLKGWNVEFPEPGVMRITPPAAADVLTGNASVGGALVIEATDAEGYTASITRGVRLGGRLMYFDEDTFSSSRMVDLLDSDSEMPYLAVACLQYLPQRGAASAVIYPTTDSSDPDRHGTGLVLSDGGSLTWEGKYTSGTSSEALDMVYLIVPFAAEGEEPVAVSVTLCTQGLEAMRDLYEVSQNEPSGVENSLFRAALASSRARTVSDSGGEEYSLVKIGAQEWMRENLRTEQLNDGTPLTLVRADDTGLFPIEAAYAWYGDDSGRSESFGALYSLAAVRHEGGLCPEGYEVPSREALQTLLAFAGDPMPEGAYCAGSWTSGEGTDAVGFAAEASGYLDTGGDYPYSGESEGLWLWTSTPDGEGLVSVTVRYAAYETGTADASQGLSVRCVRSTTGG